MSLGKRKSLAESSRKSWLDDVVGIVAAAVAALTFIALVTYSPGDPSVFTLSTSTGVSNMIGYLGSFAADLLFQVFGAASFMLPVCSIGFSAHKLFSTKHFTASRIHLTGYALALLASSSLFHLYLPDEMHNLLQLPGRSGGIVGEVLRGWLDTMFGVVGGDIISVSILLIAFVLALSFSPSTLLSRMALAVKEVVVGMKPGFSGTKKPLVKAEGRLPADAGVVASEPSVGDPVNVLAPVVGRGGAGPRIVKPEAVKEEELDGKWLISDGESDGSQFALPSLSLLDDTGPVKENYSKKELIDNASTLENKLRDYDVEGHVTQVHPGPVITMYEYAPAPGVKINRVANLSKDMALVMKAIAVRIVAPIPGKSVIGIEIPNKDRQMVAFKDILKSSDFQKGAHTLPIALGKDIFGTPVVTDLRVMPHLLIAGATGSGKSVGLNSMICSILFAKNPSDVRMLLIDPKMLELVAYENIPHLIAPIVVDPKQAISALKKMVVEMERRYMLLSASGARNLESYNLLNKNKEKILEKLAKNSGEADISEFEVPDKLPHIIVVVDELADLMLTSAKQVEEPIARLAQMARAAGMHLIVATQRPSVNVLTGVIKANFPARIAFQVSSQIDSRTIIDQKGAEQLLGMGDMLFLHPKTGKLSRVHGAFLSDGEIEKLTAFLREQPRPDNQSDLLSFVAGEDLDAEPGEVSAAEDRDEVYQKAVDLVLSTKKASASFIQRRLRIGYPRAARMIEQMESDGMIGPSNGSRPREILVKHYEDFE